MTRRLFKLAGALLPALSLLLLLATAGLAVRGQFFSCGSTFGPQNQRLTLRCSWRNGRVYAYHCPRWALSRTRPPPGFPMDGQAADPSIDPQRQ